MHPDTARATIERMNGTLRRSIKQITTHAAQVGMTSLTEADQHAIRILESRMRILERLFQVSYGSPESKAAANIELRLDTDNGKLIRFNGAEKKHSMGRLDCRGCDLIESGVGGSRLCVCDKGIQHLYTFRRRLDTPTPVVTPSEGQNGALRSTLSDPAISYLVVQQYRCEVCDRVDVLHSYNETERAPVEGTWREFRF